MPRWRFDLKWMFLWVTCMALASAVGRLDWILGAILAVVLTMVLLRVNHSLHVLIEAGQSPSWFEFAYYVLTSLAAVVFAAVLGIAMGVASIWGMAIIAFILFISGARSDWFVWVAATPCILFGIYSFGRTYYETWPRFATSLGNAAAARDNAGRPPKNALTGSTRT